METLQDTLTTIPGLLHVNGTFIAASSIAKITVEQATLVVTLCSGDNLSLAGDELRLFLLGFRAAQTRLIHGDPKLLTYEQIAHRYQVEVRTVKSWVKARKLKAIKITKRCVRFDPVSCDDRFCG